MRIKFTAGRVAGFECPPDKAQAFMWDTESKGLGLKASAGGAKKYVLESRLKSGKTIRLTIGDPKTWTIDAAQIEARRLQALIDLGNDPRELAAEKAIARVEAIQAAQAKQDLQASESRRQSITVAEAWAEYMHDLRTTNSRKKRPRSPRYIADHENLASLGGQPKARGKGLTTAGPLASLMPLPLSAITAAKVADWLRIESAIRPTNAAHAYRLLKAFIRWCSDCPQYAGIVDASAYSASEVTKEVQSSQSREGDSLQREQLPVWFAAVGSIRNRVISAYLQGLLITGARREELAALKWEDVDFQWRSLTLHDKVEDFRVIPLTPYLAQLLASLPRRNKWVFSSPRAADGKLAEPRIAHVKALVAAGLPHVSIHGLRRSFGTLAEWVEVPTGISAQIMGHKPSALAEKHYRRRPLDLLRSWHDKIEAWILEQGGVSFDSPMTQAGLRLVARAD